MEKYKLIVLFCKLVLGYTQMNKINRYEIKCYEIICPDGKKNEGNFPKS